MLFYLNNPVSSLQGPILSSWTVLQDVLDENASHYFTIAQPAAHPSAPDDTDTKGLSWLPEKLHSEEGDKMSKLHHIHILKAVTLVLIWYS